MSLINADKLRAKAFADCPSCALNGSRYCRESCNVNTILALIDDAKSVTVTCPECGAKMQEEAST